MAVEEDTANGAFSSMLEDMTKSISSVREIVKGLTQKCVIHVSTSRFSIVSKIFL